MHTFISYIYIETEVCMSSKVCKVCTPSASLRATAITGAPSMHTILVLSARCIGAPYYAPIPVHVAAVVMRGGVEVAAYTWPVAVTELCSPFGCYFALALQQGVDFELLLMEGASEETTVTWLHNIRAEHDVECVVAVDLEGQRALAGLGFLVSWEEPLVEALAGVGRRMEGERPGTALADIFWSLKNVLNIS
jgi:hypothetical protein